jgi:hypothetical protein
MIERKVATIGSTSIYTWVSKIRGQISNLTAIRYFRLFTAIILILNMVSVLFVNGSRSGHFLPRLASKVYAAPGVWPSVWVQFVRNGQFWPDHESRGGCTDPTAGTGINTDIDIGSSADCRSPGIVNPGTYGSAFYSYSDPNADSAGCGSNGDDYLYFRTRFGGDPTAGNPTFSNGYWFVGISTDTPVDSEFLDSVKKEKYSERFNMFLSPKELVYVEKKAREDAVNKSEYIRKLIEDDMKGK